MEICTVDFVAQAFAKTNTAFKLGNGTEETRIAEENLRNAVAALHIFVQKGGLVKDSIKLQKVTNKTLEFITGRGLTEFAQNLGLFDLLTAKRVENPTQNSIPEETPKQKKETVVGGLTDADPDSTTNYLDKIFYGGYGKGALLQRFKEQLVKKLIVDISKGTETKEGELNLRISEYMEELFGVIRNYAKKFTPETFLTNDESRLYTDYGSNLGKIIEEFALIEPTMNINKWTMSPSEVNELYSAYMGNSAKATKDIRDKAERFEVMMALIQLTHFDDLLRDTFGKWIQPKEGYHNTPLPEGLGKYKFKLSEGKHQKQSWGDKEEASTAWDQLNDKLRMIIETMPMYKLEQGRWVKTKNRLNKNLVDFFIKILKGDLKKIKGDTRTIKVVGNLILIFGNNATKLSLETKEFLREVYRFFKAPFTLGDLISYTRRDTYLGFKAVSDVLDTLTKDSYGRNILKNMGLSSSDIENVVSIHKNFFDSSETGESLWKASKKYYRQISNLFNTSANVEYHQLTSKDGHLTSKKMSPSASSGTIYELQNTINSNLLGEKLAALNKKYTPIVDISDPDKPTVTFFLTGDSTFKIVYSFKENTADKALSIFKTRRLSNPSEPRDDWQVATMTDKKAIFGLVKSLWGKDLFQRSDIFLALRSSYNDEQAALNYLERLFLPIYANAVAFNSIDLGDIESIGKTDYNKVSDPYALKIGEIIYKKDGDLLKQIVIIPDDPVKKVKDDLERTFFKYITTHLDVNGNKVEQEKTFYPREQGFKSQGNSTTNTIIELTDDVQVMSLKQVKNSMLDGAQYLYKKLNVWNIQKQWGDFGNTVYIKKRIGIIDSFTSRVFPNLAPLVDAVNLVNLITIKSTMRTGEGTDLAVGGTNQLDAERDVFTVLQGMDYEGNYINPVAELVKESRFLRGNTAKLNRAWETMFKGNHISREYVKGASLKQHKDFNLKENFVASFIYNYITPLYIDNKGKLDMQKIDDVVGFINAVISDKTNVPIDEVAREAVKALKTVKIADDKTLSTLGKAYVSAFKNIEEDFKTLTKFIKDEGYNYLPGKEELDPNTFAKINLTIQDDFANFNNWAEEHADWCKKYHFTPLKLLRLFSEKYNMNHRLDTIDLIEETHYRKADKAEGDQLKDHLEANLAFLQQVKRYSEKFWDKEYKKDYGIDFDAVAEAHFRRKYGNDYESALAEWKSESIYANFLKTNINNFLWALIKNDVQVDLKDSKGQYYKWVNLVGWNKDTYKKDPFYNEDKMVLAVIKDTNGKVLKQITKRSDLYGYTTEEGEFKAFTDGNGKSSIEQGFDIQSGIKVDDVEVKIQINPELELYNRRHFYFNLLQNLLKNGSHIWSDAKRDTNSPKEEGAKYFDSNKRNVVNTATNTQFRIGDIFGIPEELNIAVIEDIKALCYGENGDETHIKPYDGMTRVAPFMMYWENSALDDDVTASTKKPIMYAFLEKYLAGFVLKTASFAITNQGMRESIWDRRMMWKMTNPKWITKELGKTIYKDNFPLDITKSDKGTIYYGGDPEHKESYLYYWIDSREGKKYYRINGITKTKEVNTYNIEVQEVNAKGNPKVVEGKRISYNITKKIDSNYTFWEALGGYQSLEFDKNQEKLVDSENSIKVVAETAFKIKTIQLLTDKGVIVRQVTEDLVDKIQNSTDGQNIVDDYIVNVQQLPQLKKVVSSEDLLSSNSFVGTPLKTSDIHLLATKGAVKKGYANINGTEKYYNNEALNFMRVKAYDYGIQLDAEHEANGSVVSMMTLVISALADRGYTYNMAGAVYNALGTLTNSAVTENLGDFELYFRTKDKTTLQHTITNLLVQEFMKSDTRTSNTDIAKAVTAKLVQQGFEGKSLSRQDTLDLIPFSDGSVFNHLLSTISSIINKTAIKALMFGTLSVLCPAHNILMLLADMKLSDITSFKQLESLLNEVKSLKKLTDISLVLPKRTYQVDFKNGTTKTYIIKDLTDYYNLYDQLKPLKGTYELYEKVYDVEPTNYKIDNKADIEKIKFGWYQLNLKDGTTVGINVDSSFANALSKYSIKAEEIESIDQIKLYTRNLAPYNVQFEGESLDIHNLYDLESVRKKYETEKLIDILNKVVKKDETTGYDSISVEALTKYRQSLLDDLNSADPLDEDRMTETKKGYLESILNTYLDLDNETEFLKTLKETLQQKDGLVVMIDSLKNNIKNLTSTFLKDLYKLSLKNQPGTFLDEGLTDYSVKLYNGETVNVGDFSVYAHEALLPRIYASQYGLRKGDSLSDIKDYTFFFKRLLENYKTNTQLENYDIVLKLINGNHIYLKLNSLKPNLFLVQKQINTQIKKNKIYRRDVFGGTSHPLSSIDDLVWGNQLSKNEIIVVKSKTGDVSENLKFYLDSLNYQSIELSDRLKNDEINRKTVFDAIAKSKNNVAKDFTEDFNNENYTKYYDDKAKFIENIDKYLNPFKYVEENNYKNRGKTKSDARKELIAKDSIDSKIIKRLMAQANKQYVSFLNSLEFTVARIPAQSMQSFMAMKIVGFVEENVNNCYVCDDLIWLQGSDFDIDKATFMGYAFNDYGIMYNWSPYFSLFSYDHAKASKYLPFPTLKAFSTTEGENLFDYDLLLYDEENNPDGIIEHGEKGYYLKKDLTPKQIKTLAKLLNTFNVLATRVDTVTKKLPNHSEKLFTNLALSADADHLDLAQTLVDIVNKHNRKAEDGTVYVSKNLEMELKNYVAANAYNISSDPANIPASLTSVDVAAEPWKILANMSTFGESTTNSRPGDSSIYWSALETNQTGKDVIGITAANGVKVYYALTQVINQRLSEDKDLGDLVFDVNFNGKNYRFLADAFVALSQHLDPAIKKAIQENDLKADLMISGLLSLATDNAKELKLGKLNAGRNIAGLYLYGITIGVSAEDLFKKLTSPTAIVLDRLMKSNILLDDMKFSTLTSAIRYLANGPLILGQLQLRGLTAKGKLPINKETWEKFINKSGDSNIRPFDEKTTRISQGLLDYTTQEGADKYKTLTETLLDYMDTPENFQRYIKRFQAYKEMITNAVKVLEDSETYRAKIDAIKIKKNLNEIEDFIYLIREIALSKADSLKKIDPKQVFEDLVDIAILDDGYLEIGNIRALLGLNQGIKTLFADKMQFYENFSNFINNRALALSRQKRYFKLVGRNTSDIEAKITTLEKFAKDNAAYVEFSEDILDDNPYKVSFSKYMEESEKGKEYRALVLEIYLNIKQSFNVYKVVDSLPHYKEYLRSAYIDFESSSISAKFRTFASTLIPIINSTYKPNARTRKTYIKRATWFLETAMINSFLRQQPVLELSSDIGTGGKLTQFKIQLGTTEGNAAFKSWMEGVFIPALQNNEKFSTNTFILDLESAFNNLTLTRNTTVAYTLPISMMPRAEMEKEALSKYMVDFNSLNREVQDLKLPSGLTQNYNIVDMFFYYNLINYRNSINQNSLTPLMLSLLELGANPKLNEYMKFVSSFDRVNDFRIASDSNLQDISFTKDDILKAIAPTEDEMSISEARKKGIPYIRFYNNVSMHYELYLLSKELVDEFNHSKELRRLIRTDSYEDPADKLKELLSLREALIKNNTPENDLQIIDLDKRIKRAEARLRQLEVPDEVENYEEPDQGEQFEGELPEEPEEEMGDTSEEMFGEFESEEFEEVDAGELEEADLVRRKTWFEKNGYTPVEQNKEDIARNTPYISTIGNPIKFTETPLKIEVGRIKSANVSKIVSENGKTKIRISEIIADSEGKEVNLGDIELENIDAVLGVDIEGDAVVYSNALAVEINPTIERKLKDLNYSC